MDRSRSFPRLIAAWSAVALLALSTTGCGGGNSARATDYSRVPTATAPATIPEPIFPTGKGVALAGGLRYTVQSGDSPSSIASKFGIGVDELMAANDISDPTKLYVGQVLVIPGGATPQTRASTPTSTPSRRTGTPSPTARAGTTPTPSPAAAGARRTPSATEQIYIVQSGDNASTIAARFGITVEELAQLNDTTVDGLRRLSVGDELIVPAGQSEPSPTLSEPESSPTVPPPVEPSATQAPVATATPLP